MCSLVVIIEKKLAPLEAGIFLIEGVHESMWRFFVYVKLLIWCQSTNNSVCLNSSQRTWMSKMKCMNRWGNKTSTQHITGGSSFSCNYKTVSLFVCGIRYPSLPDVCRFLSETSGSFCPFLSPNCRGGMVWDLWLMLRDPSNTSGSIVGPA